MITLGFHIIGFVLFFGLLYHSHTIAYRKGKADAFLHVMKEMEGIDPDAEIR